MFFFVPFLLDLSYVYQKLDVLCFPSHMEAAGRSVFEAGFYHKPSIVAVSNIKNDTIIHQKTGLCIQPRKPQQIVDAVLYFFYNKAEIERMGKEANSFALEKFNIDRTAERVLQQYRNILSKKS